MDLLQLDVLLLRNTDHNRVRRLCGLAAGQRVRDKARICDVRALFHNVRVGSYRRLAQSHGAQVHDDEHGRRETGRGSSNPGALVVFPPKVLTPMGQHI